MNGLHTFPHLSTPAPHPWKRTRHISTPHPFIGCGVWCGANDGAERERSTAHFLHTWGIDMTTNLKPADELLTIRQRIKALQAREEEIKAGMKSGEVELAGDFALAHFTKRSSSRFDRKAAEAELGDLSRFEVKSETIALIVSELEHVIE